MVMMDVVDVPVVTVDVVVVVVAVQPTAKIQERVVRNESTVNNLVLNIPHPNQSHSITS